MKDDLIFIVQECICIDFLINAIMTSNIYKHLNFFSNLKKENLKNIKVICNLYKRTYNDDLLIKDTPSIKLDRNPQNNLNTLLEYSLNLLTRVDVLKKQYSNSCYNKLFQGLYNSYFDLISYIHCFCPLSSNNSFNLKSEKSDILSLNSNNHFSTFFNILSSPTLDFSNKENKIELIRDICIEAIYIFFDYYLVENLIIDEYYEIFFENNPENKFYQFFFKSNDRSFKVRVYDKSLIVFYIYQVNESILSISPPLNKVDSKLAVDWITGLPQVGVVTSDMVNEAIEEPFLKICEEIRFFLDRIPPQIYSNIADEGVFLIGGTTKIPGVGWFISQEVRIRVPGAPFAPRLHT